MAPTKSSRTVQLRAVEERGFRLFVQCWLLSLKQLWLYLGPRWRLYTQGVNGYIHYIFVSYRQVEPWKTWVRDIFVRALQDRVVRDLPGDETVYADDQLRGGATWQTALDLAIWRSRVIVPVFLVSYFESENCRRELAHMREREDACGFRTADNADGLIIPVRLSGRKYFPDEVTKIQDHDFTKFAIPSLRKNTDTYDDFEKAMDILFADIVDAIGRSQPHNPAWSSFDGGQYMPRLLRKPLSQSMPRVMAA